MRRSRVTTGVPSMLAAGEREARDDSASSGQLGKMPRPAWGISPTIAPSRCMPPYGARNNSIRQRGRLRIAAASSPETHARTRTSLIQGYGGGRVGISIFQDDAIARERLVALRQG